MTRDQAMEYLKNRGKVWVRVFRGKGNAHFGTGLMHAVKGQKALIKPSNRHKQTVMIDLDNLSFWKSRNAESRRSS